MPVKRIILCIIVICFSLNIFIPNEVLGTNLHNIGQDTLAPVLGNSALLGIKHKDKVRIEIAIESVLRDFDIPKETDLKTFHEKIINSMRKKKKTEYTIFQPVDTFMFFGASEIGKDGICVKCKIREKDRDGNKLKPRIYHAVLNLRHDAEERFSIKVYTEEEYTKRQQDPSFELSDEDILTNKREKEHQAYDKHVIKKAHELHKEGKLDMIERDISKDVDEILKAANIEIDDTICPIKERECYIIPITHDVAERLGKHKTTVMYLDDTVEAKVTLSHSSNHAIHVFVPLEYYNMLKNTPVEREETAERLFRFILSYEMGAMCNIRPKRLNYGKDIIPSFPLGEGEIGFGIGNEISQRYYESVVFGRLFDREEYKTVDLNTNLTTRDFAMDGDGLELSPNNMQMLSEIIDDETAAAIMPVIEKGLKDLTWLEMIKIKENFYENFITFLEHLVIKKKEKLDRVTLEMNSFLIRNSISDITNPGNIPINLRPRCAYYVQEIKKREDDISKISEMIEKMKEIIAGRLEEEIRKNIMEAEQTKVPLIIFLDKAIRNYFDIKGKISDYLYNLPKGLMKVYYRKEEGSWSIAKRIKKMLEEEKNKKFKILIVGSSRNKKYFSKICREPQVGLILTNEKGYMIDSVVDDKGLPEIGKARPANIYEEIEILKPYTQEIANDLFLREDKYTVFTHYTFYRNKGEYERDKYKTYVDGFNIMWSKKDDPKEYINWVAYEIENKNLDPYNVIIQLPKMDSISANITKNMLELTIKGARFMTIDTDGLIDDKERAKYRRSIFLMLLLTRNITDEDIQKKTFKYQFLYHFIYTLLENEEKMKRNINGIEFYISLLMKPINSVDINFLIKTMLSWRKPEGLDVPDPDLLAEPVMSV